MDKMKRYLTLEGADPEAVKIKGAFIPLGDYTKVPGRGPVLLAGDAAGLVDGITGEVDMNAFSGSNAEWTAWLSARAHK